MKKIKFKLSKSEVAAILQVCNAVGVHCSNNGITNQAANQLLAKIILKLLPRLGQLKQKENSVSFSLPECWAICLQCPQVLYMFGQFEKITFMRMINEITQKCC